ncbi:MAG: hypothetical protein C5B48_07765 [Candidatus Rokuibacteriota bacterium]|nr:MAG: hypothetical protein C5B48_07765 [Candidatus Rokubacteria bacterium]
MWDTVTGRQPSRRAVRGLSLAVLLIAATTVSAEAQPASTPPTADVAFPPPGAKWVIRTSTANGSIRVITYTVLEGGSYADRPVYRVTDGIDTLVYDKATANFVARVRNGHERVIDTPHAGTFSWPLEVGKKWRATRRLEDRVLGRSWDPVESNWEVEAFEDVTVPAGTFKAFRLRRTPGTNDATRDTLWYAPDLKLVVREVEERLRGHYQGPGTSTNELVEYRPPRPASPAPSVAASPSPSTSAGAPVAATTPSTSASPTADVGFPPPGSKWVMRTARPRGPTRDVTYTVLEDGSYADRPVHRVTDTVDILMYDRSTANFVATVRNGEVRISQTPHAGTFSWPLAVGKKWRATRRVEDRVLGRSWEPVESNWEVEAFEDITVPAGTFKAFRLRWTPGTNEAARGTLWYAPDVKLVVRKVDERLRGHYLGPGTSTSELVEYHPAAASTAVAASPSPSTSPPIERQEPARPPAGAASPAVSARVAAAPNPAGMHSVIYRVKGTAEEAKLIYRNAQGELVQSTIRIPDKSAWSVSFEVPLGRLLYVAAQNAGSSGSVGCEILLDGNVVAQVSGTGAYINVSCNEMADH